MWQSCNISNYYPYGAGKETEAQRGECLHQVHIQVWQGQIGLSLCESSFG
jgi:hypothetical protein